MATAPLLVVQNRIKKRMHVLFGLLIAMGLLVLAQGEMLVGLLCLGLFGVGYLFLLRRVRQQPIALTVEEEGVRITNPAIFLPWAEITGVGTWRFASNEVVGFNLRDREAAWNHLAANGTSLGLLKANASFGYDLFVSSSVTDPPASEVAKVIAAELAVRTAQA